MQLVAHPALLKTKGKSKVAGSKWLTKNAYILALAGLFEQQNHP